MTISLQRTCLLTALTFTHTGALAQHHPFESADAARDLVDALDANGLHFIAVEDPAESGRFMAALHLPRSQLLVISARHPSTEAIRDYLATGQYRAAYLSLVGSPITAGKFFVNDAGADGILSALPDSSEVDLVRMDGGREQVVFNGDLAGQQLTSAEYQGRLLAADASYARVLKILTAAVDPP